MANLLIGYSC